MADELLRTTTYQISPSGEDLGGPAPDKIPLGCVMNTSKTIMAGEQFTFELTGKAKELTFLKVEADPHEADCKNVEFSWDCSDWENLAANNFWPNDDLFADSNKLTVKNTTSSQTTINITFAKDAT